jgi:hypothetical protein
MVPAAVRAPPAARRNMQQRRVASIAAQADQQVRTAGMALVVFV